MRGNAGFGVDGFVHMATGNAVLYAIVLLRTDFAFVFGCLLPQAARDGEKRSAFGVSR